MNVTEELSGDDSRVFLPGTLVSCPKCDTFMARHQELQNDRHIWLGSYSDSEVFTNTIIIGIVLTVTPGGGCNTLLLTSIGMRWTWTTWLTKVNA